MSYKSRKRKSENRKNIQLFYNLVKIDFLENFATEPTKTFGSVL